MASETFEIVVKESGAKKASEAIDKIGKSAEKSEGSLTKLERRLRDLSAAKVSNTIPKQFDAASKSAKGFENTIASVTKKLLALTGVTLLINKFKDLSSTWLEMNSRLTLMTGSVEAAVLTMEELRQVAFNSRKPLADVVGSFNSNAIALNSLGYTTRQQISFTSALTNAMTISGASAQAYGSVVYNLSQAMMMGKLSGQNWMWVIQNGGRMIQALADGLGITIGELNTLAKDGALSSEMVFNALTSQSEKLKEELLAMPMSINQAFTNLGNEILVAVGKFSESSELGQSIASFINFIAANVDTIGQFLKVLAILVSTFILLPGAISMAVGAFKGFAIAVASNPIGFVVVALTSLVAYLAVFRNEMAITSDGLVSLGDLFSAIWSYVNPAIAAFEGVANEVAVMAGAVSDSATGIEVSFEGILRFVARFADTFIGLLFGLVNTAENIFLRFWPAVYDVCLQGINLILSKVSQFVNSFIKLLQPIAALANIQIGLVDFKIDNAFKGQAVGFARGFASSFTKGLQDSKLFENGLNTLMGKAREISNNRRAGRAGGSGILDAARQGAGLGSGAGARGGSGSGSGSQSEIEKLSKELESLTSKYNKAYAAEQQFNKGMTVLNAAVKAGLITNTNAAFLIEAMTIDLEKSRFPLQAINKEIQKESMLIKMSSEERAIYNKMEEYTNRLREHGIKLTEQETADLKQKITQQQAENTVAERRAKLLERIQESRKYNPISDIGDIQALMNEGKISRIEGLKRLESGNSDLLGDNTDIIIQQYQDTFARIDALRQADLLKEEEANVRRIQMAFELNKKIADARVNVANMMLDTGQGDFYDMQISILGQLTEGYTTFFAGATESLGTFIESWNTGMADSIGRAIVYSEDFGESLKSIAKDALAQLISQLIQVGIQSLANFALNQTLEKAGAASSVATAATTGASIAASMGPAAAMTSMATYGANTGPAIAGMTAIMSLLPTLLSGGFKDGGFTGSGGISQIAGVVHGQEFVTNAKATKKYRPILESMNNGTFGKGSSSSSNIKINVNNYNGSNVNVQKQEGPDGTTMNIIIDSVAKQVENRLAQGVTSGTGMLNKSIQGAYGLRRGK
jgi:tape measure domain-containing protein